MSSTSALTAEQRCEELARSIRNLCSQPGIPSRGIVCPVPKRASSPPTDKPWRSPPPPTHKPWRAPSPATDKAWRSPSPSSAPSPSPSPPSSSRFPPPAGPSRPQSPAVKTKEKETIEIILIYDAKTRSCRPCSPRDKYLKAYFPCPPVLDSPESWRTNVSPPQSPKINPRVGFSVPLFPINIPSLPPPPAQLDDTHPSPEFHNTSNFNDFFGSVSAVPTGLLTSTSSPEFCFGQPWEGEIVVNIVGARHPVLDHGVTHADHQLLEDGFTTAACAELWSRSARATSERFAELGLEKNWA